MASTVTFESLTIIGVSPSVVQPHRVLHVQEGCAGPYRCHWENIDCEKCIEMSWSHTPFFLDMKTTESATLNIESDLGHHGLVLDLFVQALPDSDWGLEYT